MSAETTSDGRDWQTADDVPWTLLEDVDELADAYWSVVAPALRADGHDPETDKPTHQWLRNNGFRSLLYTLREHHDRAFGQFWRDDLGLDDGRDDTHWSTDDDRTVEALDAFLTSKRNRAELAESSIRTLQYRLDRYVRAYCAVNETDDLVTPVARESDVPARDATDQCWAAFDRLHARLDSPTTKRRIHLAVSNWYDHLKRRKWAAVNPADGLANEYRWNDAANGDTADATDTPCLDADHVRALFETADNPREQLLVVALAGWGLRPNEVASLHYSQFETDGTDDEVPYIAFDDRKNGPGEVSLLFGQRVLDDRIAELGDDEDWSGYLFPSPHASNDHVTRNTIYNWFSDLADRAGLPDAVDGVSVSPKLCRRFWYDAYSSVLEGVLEGVEDIAAEQGSSDPQVVMQNYLSDERARTVRREFMRDQLTDAFGKK
ncbi:tyrosine-type recombinase/integrase [Halorussus salinisoli]|uniref:tyrosine-type recombinase/integrase n=1 Tax=Halorussus salinisoli TaxID=2558242 RepID=UPI0010C17CE4|nr:site-specific integrase [Halorussus salinisoli]